MQRENPFLWKLFYLHENKKNPVHNGFAFGSLCNRGMGLHRNGLFEPICFYQGGNKNWHTTVIKIFFRTLIEKKDDKDGERESLQGD